MTEISYLFDPSGPAKARAIEHARLTETLAMSPQSAEQGAETEAGRLAWLRGLALAGLTRVAEKNDRVKPEATMEVITSRHAAGHNRTLPR